MLREKMLISFVYAKCSKGERSALWEEMVELSTTRDPWLIGGDFSIVREATERLGGIILIFGQLVTLMMPFLNLVSWNLIRWGEILHGRNLNNKCGKS